MPKWYLIATIIWAVYVIAQYINARQNQNFEKVLFSVTSTILYLTIIIAITVVYYLPPNSRLNQQMNNQTEKVQLELDQNIDELINQFFMVEMRRDAKRWIKTSTLQKITNKLLTSDYPFLLYSIIYVESRFNPNAKSKSNAIGLGQVKYKFWKDKLKQAGIIENYQDMFDPEIGVDITEYVFKEHLNKYNFNIRQALIHYYCGNKSCKFGRIYANRILSKYGELIFKINNVN